MAFFKIKGNALDFQLLTNCIAATTGSRGQKKVKDDFLCRIMKDVWPEMDPAREDLVRIDDKSEEAKQVREMQMDTVEQGVLAEAFLAAVNDAKNTVSHFRMYRQAAKLIRVSKWFDEQTSEKFPDFAGKADDPEPTAYADAPSETPKTA